MLAKPSSNNNTSLACLDLSALQHSDVTFAFTFTRPAVAAFVEWTVTEIKETKDGSRSEPKTTSLPPRHFSEDRRSATLVMPARVTGNYRLVLEAEHGIRTELDAKTLTVRVDQPPQVVKFAGKDELKAILPYERLPLELTVGDDVGVARADLEYSVNNGEAKTERMTLTGVNLQEATAKHIFPLAGKVREDDEISYRIRVQDNRPKEYGGPQTVYYPAERWLQLKVVKQAAPLREQEILAQRNDLNKRLDAIRTNLQREQRGVWVGSDRSRVTIQVSPPIRRPTSNNSGKTIARPKTLYAIWHTRRTRIQPWNALLARRNNSPADREMRQSDAATPKSS